jgi:Uma2 family endonuclease
MGGRWQMAPAPTLTTADYQRTPVALHPMELAFGELRVSDAPLTRHQQAVGAFFLALAPHVRARALGTVWIAPLDVILDEPRALVVQPDLLFVSNARADIVRERIYGPPDMVLEVLSPEPRVGHTDERLKWFGTYGVRECWLVRVPERRMEVLRFDGRVVVHRRVFAALDPIVSEVLPEFRLTLDQVMA